MKKKFGGPPRDYKRGTKEIRVLFEDDAVLAVDKPAGLAAVPVPGTEMPSAWAVVAKELRERRQRCYVVHRIDRFTSGVMLFAKTVRDRDALVKQFLAHTPRREYVAVVRGEVEPGEGTLTHYFRRDGQHQIETHAKDRKGTKAELQYALERKLRGASVVRVRLVTGLQNQIRVQFSVAGHPVVGDRKYHPEEANEKRIDRVALHAAKLAFQHPRTGEQVTVQCDVPGDIRRLIAAP